MPHPASAGGPERPLKTPREELPHLPGHRPGCPLKPESVGLVWFSLVLHHIPFGLRPQNFIYYIYVYIYIYIFFNLKNGMEGASSMYNSCTRPFTYMCSCLHLPPHDGSQG